MTNCLGISECFWQTNGAWCW